MVPAEVSTCGAHTIDGFFSRMSATTSAIGGGEIGADGAPHPSVGRAMCTWSVFETVTNEKGGAPSRT